jgi:hypothetical protein
MRGVFLRKKKRAAATGRAIIRSVGDRTEQGNKARLWPRASLQHVHVHAGRETARMANSFSFAESRPRAEARSDGDTPRERRGGNVATWWWW